MMLPSVLVKTYLMMFLMIFGGSRHLMIKQSGSYTGTMQQNDEDGCAGAR